VVYPSSPGTRLLVIVGIVVFSAVRRGIAFRNSFNELPIAELSPVLVPERIPISNSTINYNEGFTLGELPRLLNTEWYSFGCFGIAIFDSEVCRLRREHDASELSIGWSAKLVPRLQIQRFTVEDGLQYKHCPHVPGWSLASLSGAKANWKTDPLIVNNKLTIFNYSHPWALVLPHLSLDGLDAALRGVGLLFGCEGHLCSVSQLSHIQHDDSIGLVAAGFHFVELPLHNIRLSNEDESGDGSHHKYATGQPNHQSYIKFKFAKFLHTSIIFLLISIIYFAVIRLKYTIKRMKHDEPCAP
jgi:hypothetical protein